MRGLLAALLLAAAVTAVPARAAERLLVGKPDAKGCNFSPPDDRLFTEECLP